jgi:NitT/TauT family transport system ATP-binding protein
MNSTDPPFLSVTDLSHQFRDGGRDQNESLPVLEAVSFDVSVGQFVCLLGPSGSGKSTLLRIIAGLLAADSGRVALRGTAVQEPPAGVRLVFQQANLMPWRNVHDNIRLPLEVAGWDPAQVEVAVSDLIELVGLEGFGHSLPRDLSGGMAQRVAIARALVSDPELLLMDEPFGALDALTREKMGLELLRVWAAKRKTVLMVTHDISEAVFLADRVLVLSERPARVILDRLIDLPRPRVAEIRYSPEFNQLAQALRAAIG